MIENFKEENISSDSEEDWEIKDFDFDENLEKEHEKEKSD